jgi:hypothetical protein
MEDRMGEAAEQHPLAYGWRLYESQRGQEIGQRRHPPQE